MRVPNGTHPRRVQINIIGRQRLPACSATSLHIGDLPIVLITRQQPTCNAAFQRLLGKRSIEERKIAPVSFLEISRQIDSQVILEDRLGRRGRVRPGGRREKDGSRRRRGRDISG